MLTIQTIQNSTVLLRADLNLPSLKDDARVVATLPTIKLLLQNHNKVVLITHWGRPEGFDDKWSTSNMVDLLKTHLQQEVEFVNQYQGIELAKQQITTSNSQVFILENTRFEPREQSKDKQKRTELASEYAILGDIFVDEAFAVSHRQEATNYELKKMLPNCLGLNYQQEIDNLNKIKFSPEHPYVVIISGNKIETKLPLIEKFLDKADHILVGGMICFTFIEAKKQLLQEQGRNSDLESIPDLKDSFVETDFLPRAKDLLQNYETKIVLPVDFAYHQTEDGKILAYDIGTKTIEYFSSFLKNCKTVFWNGPLGFYEMPPFNYGTVEIAKFLASQNDCYIVTGGGDINSAVPPEYLEKFSWVSTGGGATLEYLGQ